MSTVLVVDDQSTNRELVRDILTYRGHTVIEAHEGAEALSLAHAQHPDLVLTDVLMPGMDGYQLAQELRAAPDTADTPIVFLTANYLPAEAQPVATACGVAAVLLKSVDPQTLLDTVDQAIAAQPQPEFDLNQATQARQRAVDAKLVERTDALAETAARFQLMADHSPVGTVFGDRHGTANYVNSRFAAIMGLPADDLLGLGWLRCVNPDQRDEILAVTATTQPAEAQHHFRGQVTMPNGTTRWLHVRIQVIPHDDGTPSGFITTVDDITTMVEADQQKQATDRKRYVDARVRATQRLEGLSRLAGGVAHDFNNILGAMLGFETFVTEGITDLIDTGHVPADTGRTLLRDLEQIRNGGHRATDLTQQLLTFGSRKHLSVTPLDLNEAIRESCDLLAPSIGEHTNIVTDLARNLRPILAEPVNIAQILLNLTMNARDAMSGGGTLTIATSNVALHDENRGGLAAGPYAQLIVRDTGDGMTPDVLERALEPFFTTKGRGTGTGLGLATTYGVVNQLSGSLRIESAPGRGTTITIHLPTTEETVASPPPPTHQPAHGGTETVLLADDEDGIRETATRILTNAGYTVITAANGPEALELAKNHQGPIDLLLSDVMMPGMLGPELADRLTIDHPAITVLFMSGYADGLINDRGLLPSDTVLLPKPFTASQLLTAMRTSLLETQRPA